MCACSYVSLYYRVIFFTALPPNLTTSMALYKMLYFGNLGRVSWFLSKAWDLVKLEGPVKKPTLYVFM